MPLAFTEEGIYMLMTVLCGDLATKQSKALIRGYLILNGNPFRADVVYDEIYKQANQSINIVDNYIGLKTLEKLIDVQSGVDVSIFSDNLAKEWGNLMSKKSTSSWSGRRKLLKVRIQLYVSMQCRV